MQLANLLTLAVALSAGTLSAQDPSMLRGIGWRSDAVFTFGNAVGNYTPPGIPDGMGAFAMRGNRLNVLVNHELNPGNGYAYSLANGTMLTGARVSSFELGRRFGRVATLNAGLAYDTIYDRQGNIVTDPAQINETGNAMDGLARLCSATSVEAGTYGFVDDLFLTGEETGKPFHPHGGTEWVLDVDNDELWAAPALGRGAWENVSPFRTGMRGTVGLLLGDDTATAPLYLYLGVKNGVGDQSFLDRNGLKMGQLYFWVADNGDTTPEQFNGEGQVRTGAWQPIAVRDAAMAGMAGYDADGYLDNDTLRMAAQTAGGFQFSRPEDVHVNPADGTQLVFASTGRGAVFPSDNWGTTYIVDIDPMALTATLTIVADSDGMAVPDNGIRNPDNLTWADNGMVYIQEDRSTSPSSLFGAASGMDASVWELDPVTGIRTRIAEVNRTVLLPVGVTDAGDGTLGVWETSGVIDVTNLLATAPGETLLLANVQAHGIQDGIIGGNPFLDEGGQLVFLSTRGVDHSVRTRDDSAGVSVDVDVTNGTPGNGYAVVLAFANAGNAPNGWFFGIDVTFAELGISSVSPLVGLLDATGNAGFSVSIPSAMRPLGYTVDVVALELSMDGTPAVASPAVTHRF